MYLWRMSDRFCPCGARLNRSSSVRSLGSPFLRMFMSIRTMKSLSSTTRVCNICRHLYKKWRRENPEFNDVLGYMESGDSEIEGSDTNSVRDGFHPSVLLHRESFARLIQWICVGQNCDLGKVKLMFLKFCVKY